MTFDCLLARFTHHLLFLVIILMKNIQLEFVLQMNIYAPPPPGWTRNIFFVILWCNLKQVKFLGGGGAGPFPSSPQSRPAHV